jgi:uncharacterized protein YegL
MRRLPIFFLVDVSESMAGESLGKLEQGLSAVLSILRKDPYALETVFLSVIAFAGKAKTITALTDIISFRPPELPIGGGTALGAALGHLMDEINRTVVRTTSEQKGDWKPIIFLLTDGHPTDDPAKSVERWNRSYRTKANLIAVSVGGTADHALLKTLTDEVLVFNDAAPDAFARFLKWVTASIQTHSRSVNAGRDGKVDFAKVEPGLLALVEHAEGLTPFVGVDDRYVVLVGKCVKTKLPYLLKYEKSRQFGGGEASYNLVAAVPMKNSYFELSEGAGSGSSVSTRNLEGFPPCPHCGSEFSVARCRCGGMHCIEGAGTFTCTWCGNSDYYKITDRGLDFERRLG